MPKILTKLRIDEISSVDRGAGEGCRIMLYKRDGGKPMVGKPDGWDTPLMFNDVMKMRKLSEVAADEADVRDEPGEDKLTPKLRAMVDAMLVAVPTLDRQTAQHFLLHHPRGRHLANHLNELSKGDTMTTQVDIRKLIPVLEEGLLARAKNEMRDGETEARAFTRIYENDVDFRKSWATVTEAKQLLLLSKSTVPNLMSTTPVATEVGNTLVEDDSAAAVAELQALAEKQHRTFEQVFLDPDNGAIADRTYGRSANWHSAAYR
jgi:hypothetical protein